MNTAVTYLKQKQGSKGKEITNKELTMSEYLLPSSGMSINDQRKIFSMRNIMVNIPNNFPNKQKEENCICGEKIVNMKHIYNCEVFNDDVNENTKTYEYIFLDDEMKQLNVLRKFESQFQKREQMLNIIKIKDITYHVIQIMDPLFSVLY